MTVTFVAVIFLWFAVALSHGEKKAILRHFVAPPPSDCVEGDDRR
jgi:hypothetical protein